MSTFANYCQAYNDLAGSIYAFDGTIILNLDNNSHDRVSLTLSPMQAMILADGLHNVASSIPVSTNKSALINGCLTLDFPIEWASDTPPKHADNEEYPIIYLDKKRPVA